jgi:nicotinate-nucleotide--dimethylbenzimidazole phosphoribosyltransferase
VAIFAGDHGVHAQGVTPWPQEVTSQMVANFLGGGAVCNAFANQVGAEVCVIDVGVASDLPATPGLLPRKIRAGTSDMTTGPAMTREEAKQAIEVGIETARDLVAAGNKALLTGEMGIANTTSAAALCTALFGGEPSDWVGPGTGVDAKGLGRKAETIAEGLKANPGALDDPLEALRCLGGFELAAIAGAVAAARLARTPVVLDGYACTAAAAVLAKLDPRALDHCIVAHRSAEPGHARLLEKLGKQPLFDFGMRLGEGSGAALAIPILKAAVECHNGMATFAEAGVSGQAH